MGHPARRQELRTPCLRAQHHCGCPQGHTCGGGDVQWGQRPKAVVALCTCRLGQEGVAQGNSIHDGGVADLEGSTSELFAWSKWKREQGS